MASAADPGFARAASAEGAHPLFLLLRPCPRFCHETVQRTTRCVLPQYVVPSSVLLAGEDDDRCGCLILEFVRGVGVHDRESSLSSSSRLFLLDFFLYQGANNTCNSVDQRGVSLCTYNLRNRSQSGVAILAETTVSYGDTRVVCFAPTPIKFAYETIRRSAMSIWLRDHCPAWSAIAPALSIKVARNRFTPEQHVKRWTFFCHVLIVSLSLVRCPRRRKKRPERAC